MKPEIEPVKEYLLHLQEKITEELVNVDPLIKIQAEDWNRPIGGGGRTRALTGEGFIEKAGVNFSHVWGDSLPLAATATRPQLKDAAFQVVGLSLIIHPSNPYAPTCHANLRLFMAEDADKNITWWFGGGFDLTPFYGFEEDCIHWHKRAKEACDPFGVDVYSHYKDWADRYFYLQHRQEARGIGGIFFDDLNEWGFENCFAFIRQVGEQFIAAYFPIIEKRKCTPFSETERQFQLYRRGRYVEFNLLYDRGTVFGLQTGGRTESILISLPPLVSWQYNWQPKKGSKEAELYDYYLKPQDWANK